MSVKENLSTRNTCTVIGHFYASGHFFVSLYIFLLQEGDISFYLLFNYVAFSAGLDCIAVSRLS